MERLFFGSDHVRLQNFSRQSRLSKKAIPGYFVQYRLDPTARYSILEVEILCSRPPPTLETLRAEFRRDVDEFFEESLGAEKWLNMKRALVHPPRWTCVRVCPSTDAEDTLALLKEEIVKFNKGRLRPSSPLIPYPHPDMRNFYRLDFAPEDETLLSNPPTLRVAVDTKCGEAVLRGADVFAPGIRGASSQISPGDLVSVYVDLDSKVLHGDKEISNDRLLFIGVGRAEMSRTQMICTNRSGLAVLMLTRPGGDAPALGHALPGRIFLQNLPSCVVGVVLNPQPGELVLDMCASPGGKTSHLADLMEEQGILVACDRSVNKCIPVRETCDSFARTKGKQSIVRVCRTDSAKPCIGIKDYGQSSFEERKAAIEHSLNGLSSEKGILLLPPGGLPKGAFDKVLLDGPCSALGLRPRLSHVDMTLKMLNAHALVQKLMLFNALQLAKVDGIIVYSTCTINPIENEEVVQWLITSYPNHVELMEAKPRLGGPGLTSCLGQNATKVQRFDPCDESLDCMGFFIAKFRKVRAIDDGVRFIGLGSHQTNIPRS